MASERKCCVPSCKTTHVDHLALHKFPNPEKDPERFKRWLMVIGGDILSCDNNYIYKNRRVCHEHFESKYHGAGKLFASAIPTLNLSGFYGYMSQEAMTDITNVEDKNLGSSFGLTEPSTSKGSEYVSGRTMETDQQKKITLNFKDGPNQNSQDEQDSLTKQDSQVEYCGSDTETLVESQKDTFSWQKINEIATLEDAPVLHLEVEYSDAGSLVAPSTPPATANPTDTDSLRCCECGHHIPQDSIRCVCVSCPEGHICTSCETSDAHCHHYVLRAPRNATQSEVREVLQRVRLVLLPDSTHKYDVDGPIKPEVKDEEQVYCTEENMEEDDPRCVTHPHTDTERDDDSRSEVPDVDLDTQGTSRLTTSKSSGVQLAFYQHVATRKRSRSESQSKDEIPKIILKEISIVLNPLENLWNTTRASKPSQDNKTLLDKKGIQKLVGNTFALCRLPNLKIRTVAQFRNLSANDAAQSKESDSERLKDQQLKSQQQPLKTYMTKNSEYADIERTSLQKEEPKTSNENT